MAQHLQCVHAVIQSWLCLLQQVAGLMSNFIQQILRGTGNKELTCCCASFCRAFARRLATRSRHAAAMDSLTVLVGRRWQLLCLGHDGVGGSVLVDARGVTVASLCPRRNRRCCDLALHAAGRHLRYTNAEFSLTCAKEEQVLTLLYAP